MNQVRKFKKAVVTEKAERKIKFDHPWVYDTEILTEEEGIEDGTLVDVVSRKNRYLGTGFYNSHSKIRIRILSKNANDTFDEAFFERRLRYAVQYRKAVMGDDFDAVRLIFGEADFFPGLTVDKFHNVLVVQVLSLGIEKIKPMLFSLLIKVLKEEGEEITAIYERNDVRIRELEGMRQNKGFFLLPKLHQEFDKETVTIEENGLKFSVDFVQGQKTGFFLDQKYNRRRVGELAKGHRVLDCFTHTGAFALCAAKGGASHVTAIDISGEALNVAKENARQNGLEEKIDFLEANVFDYLTKLAAAKEKPYDFIILDPPAFTKSHDTVENAEKGYKEINLRAMKILPRGGYLATCSCSHFMTDKLFRDMLKKAATDAKVSLRQIEMRQQAPDHPILWNVPETNYLKFYIFQVV